ncbi:hypothetical protein SBOR_7037 [Sclerotinia borealis F-4128]|uniref:Uncharacterized protein n=1 Tax=Sclerotinia borealis (strain F-4128) TaxID=1432307 RepID=W9C737_SCLBF|nr:hypothetical protein SBOR_7037 [Sclerotinia borealis F-4128]
MRDTLLRHEVMLMSMRYRLQSLQNIFAAKDSTPKQLASTSVRDNHIFESSHAADSHGGKGKSVERKTSDRKRYLVKADAIFNESIYKRVKPDESRYFQSLED